MASADRTLGDIAGRLLFENARVRIWEMAIVPQPDTLGPYRAYEEADVLPGRFFYVERGGIEAARNVGRRAYHELIIELKD